MQTKTKRRTITKEFFAYAKSVITGRAQSTDKQIASYLDCSVPTVKRIEDAKDFSDFKAKAKIRSRKETAAKKVDKNIESKPEQEKQVQTSLFDINATEMLVAAIGKLSMSITSQTLAIEENTKAYKNLRDRMAVANQLKARELHNKIKAELKEQLEPKEEEKK